MVRPALAAGRALAVLDYFAAHPEQSYTLSELSEALDINLASLLAVLRALTDAGYLARHPQRKTYGLGMSVVALGHAALTRHQVVDRARGELRALAAESGLRYVVSAVAGDSIVILAVEGRGRTPEVWAGMRLPLLPPLGQVFLAWSGAGSGEIRRWLDRTAVGAPLTGHLDTAMAVVRERGWSANRDTAARRALGEALARLADAPRDTGLRARVAELVVSLGDDYEVLSVAADERYRLATLSAPVFDQHGSVALALTATGLPELDGARVRELAGQLADVAGVLGAEIGGRPPVLSAG
ncbi:helix-turn-helix domain-containing protein [Streptomyces sp. TRM66268-LWL]|uniref:Helix-turn-helix domain-containing protein n=1 Tax=Streptomyces polyasparticus TaxID=2767826 RepID=A0ABR7SSI8_9ACTN|nr:helix-turn-helix domain-containing protein [Streptomyces polyasparticus]MBC9718461.1 helix-turn-helix domain-containing protein [Streptomyces polyasparticus]